ncbi:MAG TPA: hypothetical protein DIS98_07040 [Colwellia sp.]|nr:hypothetical protein [Colwellia sp.]|tara:strand:- start:6903 stop:7613 length:711 start_codon:yes stop_codon:yes gene_type:complete
MSRDNFDEEITSLYQQRKQQVVAPKIILAQESSNTKYSPLKLLTIFFAGSMASFGIMAIISHFSTLPENLTTAIASSQSTNLIELAPKQPDEIKALPVKVLPPIPENVSPISQKTLQPELANRSEQLKPHIVTTGPVSVMSLPSLSEPLIVIEPIYKVLPEYSITARQERESGKIKLNYNIDITGKVNNITIVSNSISRNLQRAAKKALSQWQYKPNEQLLGKDYQVIFKFTLSEN